MIVRKRSLGWCLAFACAALIAAGCSHSADGGDAAAKAPGDAVPTTEVATIPTCASRASVGISALPESCRDQLFVAQLQSLQPTAKKFSQAELVGFGQSLCALSHTSVDSRATVTKNELFRSTSQSWGVAASFVADVASADADLCPDDIEALQAIKIAPVEVGLAAGGSKSASVSYVIGPATSSSDQSLPWADELTIHASSDISLTVNALASGKQQLSCAISIDGQRVSGRTSSTRRSLTCQITQARVDEVSIAKG
jgi:hypothetical protein